jgi:hypothetical protein
MELTEEQKEFLDMTCDGKWTLNSEGKIDVKSDIFMNQRNISEVPVKFGKVYGNFICSYNNLTSLKNFPDYISNSLFIGNNKIETFDFFPEVETLVFLENTPLKNYFQNVKEEDFPYWDKLDKRNFLNEYPFMVNIIKKYTSSEIIKQLLNEFPQTKLYLK